MKKPVTKRTWDDFRAAGLLFFINTVLHAFGWALVVEVDSDTQSVTNCYPARVTFRGFDEESQTEEHIKIANYLAETASEFPEEANS
jgi:hypothetical protein